MVALVFIGYVWVRSFCYDWFRFDFDLSFQWYVKTKKTFNSAYFLKRHPIQLRDAKINWNLNKKNI